MVTGPQSEQQKGQSAFIQRGYIFVYVIFTMKVNRILEFEVLRAVYMKDMVFWIMTQGRQIEMY